MAYVAITGKLIDSVRYIINLKKHEEQKLLTSPATTFTVSGYDPAYLAMVWGDHIKLKDVIPHDWMGEINSAYLGCKYERQQDGQISTWGQVSVSLTFNPPLPTPPKAETYHRRFTVDQDHPMLVPLIDYEIAVRGVNAKWDKVFNDLATFLRSCKSLNEALKLWPDCRLYIDRDYLDKVEQKTERGTPSASRAAEALKNIDTNQAVASLVELRILQANGAPS
jgi:hypothetical protein